MHINFGTDGVRGTSGKAPILPEFFLQIGRTIGAEISRNKQRPKIVLGRDPRVSGPMLQSAVNAGLLSQGVDVRLLGVMPSPAVALLTKLYGADLGVVISASHNPWQDNGLKCFDAQGHKASFSFDAILEKRFLETHLDAQNYGALEMHLPGKTDYLQYCRNTFPDLSLTKMHIVVDCANGAMSSLAPQLYRTLGAQVDEYATSPQGDNINYQCGATCLDPLIQLVKEKNADLGLAFDGDGDRLMMVDGAGNVLDGDLLVFVIALYLRAINPSWKPGIVGTMMSNQGLVLACQSENIPFERVAVGDRNIYAKLLEKKWTLGAENSGHILSLQHSPTGDGLIASLLVFSALQKLQLSVSSLCDYIQMMPQVLLNVKTDNPQKIMTNPTFLNAVDVLEKKLHGEGRVLVRPSGTEPLLRVMVEAHDAAMAHQEATQLCELAKMV